MIKKNKTVYLLTLLLPVVTFPCFANDLTSAEKTKVNTCAIALQGDGIPSAQAPLEWCFKHNVCTHIDLMNGVTNCSQKLNLWKANTIVAAATAAAGSVTPPPAPSGNNQQSGNNQGNEQSTWNGNTNTQQQQQAPTQNQGNTNQQKNKNKVEWF